VRRGLIALVTFLERHESDLINLFVQIRLLGNEQIILSSFIIKFAICIPLGLAFLLTLYYFLWQIVIFHSCGAVLIKFHLRFTYDKERQQGKFAHT
jgi:membrane protein implicated in regulation of membrane protease activity